MPKPPEPADPQAAQFVSQVEDEQEVVLQQVTPEQMADVMRAHITWLESYTKARPELQPLGLDLLPAFSYELIQIMNHVWLQSQATLEESLPA